MASSNRLRSIQLQAAQFTACETLDDLAYLLEIPAYKLVLLSKSEEYNCFKIPKSDGTYRYIEAPDGEHKSVLKKLNYYLQCVYHFVRPNAVYGFVISPKEEMPARNIVTHAQAHLGANYMLNADFEDFFHQIKEERIYKLFDSTAFQLRSSAAATLAQLCVFNGRLPMGSPTSPVLSNFAALTMDATLETLAEQHQLHYTRFADDLTFSSTKKIPANFFAQVTAVCSEHGFQFNPDKTKWYGKNETKIVTGLEVTDKVRLPHHFFSELADNLERLKHLNEAKMMVKGDRSSRLLRAFTQQIEGKLNFVEMVYGAEDEKAVDYNRRFVGACSPKLSKYALRWMELPYGN